MLEVSVEYLLSEYEGFLLDAYGVLVNSDHTLPGADQFLRELRRRGIPFRLISNDGSTTPEAKAKKWALRGLQVEPELLLTPWSVLGSGLSPISLNGKGCFLIGTPLSEEMLERAGGHLVETASELEVFLLADELLPDLMATCDRGLSLLVEAFRAGGEPQLVLVNPDLVYPSSTGFGLTAGAIALMFEAALKRLLGRNINFTRIGKPGPGLYTLGLEQMKLEASSVVMVGDQWETDILGARNAGVPSVLVGTGVGTFQKDDPEQMYLASLGTE